MLKLALPLAVAMLSGCASMSSFDASGFTTEAERQAYLIGSAHAGLEFCSASLDPQALSLHKTAALNAALAQTGARPERLHAAFSAGLLEGGGFGSPHRVACADAAFVLNCSLEDYLGQWRAGERVPR